MLRIATLFLALAVTALAAPKVTIVVGENAPALEKLASGQLARDLGALFGVETGIRSSLPADPALTILLGSPSTNPAIPRDDWPPLSEQGHLLKSTGQGLIVGGGSPAATLWAAGELSYRFGIRHLLHGDVLPVEKPAFTLNGLDVMLDTKTVLRAWDDRDPERTRLPRPAEGGRSGLQVVSHPSFACGEGSAVADERPA
ncbi:MAG: hypothetical protein ABMA01_18125 [Chthoniobacteraceae bacterium]